MKAEHLNSFIRGAQDILATICGETVGLGKLSVKQFPYQCGEVAVTIGFTGDLKGHVVLSMHKNTAVYLASKLMAGMDESMVMAMWESAVSEITNMISGSVATIFFGNGETVDITPPTLISNPQPGSFSFVSADSKLVCMPLTFTNGSMVELDVLMS